MLLPRAGGASQAAVTQRKYGVNHALFNEVNIRYLAKQYRSR